MAMDPAARTRWLVRVLVLVVVIGAAVVLRLTYFAPEPLRVRVVPVERGRVEATVTNSKAGTLKSRRRARVSAETGGRVVEVQHREGDVVEAGEILVRLNDAAILAELELSDAAIVASQARHKEVCLNRDRAGREFERNKQLASQDIASEDNLDRLQSIYLATSAGCEAAAAEVETALARRRAVETELAKTRIRAPFDGVVAELNTEIGEWVTPSPPLLTSPAVVDMLDPASIYVSAPMDEVDSNRIAVGQLAKITVDSRPGESFMGKVVRVAPYVLDIEAQNRTVEIEVDFDRLDPKLGLLAGTSADVEIILDTRPDALRIPSAALLEGGRVLLLRDGLLEERDVSVGIRNWDFAEILSGIEAGELIVTSLDRKEIVAGAKAEAEPMPEVAADR